MGKLKRIRYWLLGILAGSLCLVSSPAIAHLAPANAPVASSPTIAQGITTSDQQAQRAFSQGQYQAAVTLLQQAIQQYEAQGQTVPAAIALSNLSLTHQELGNWQAAETALTQAWRWLEQQPTSLAVQAQILDVQGQLEFSRGQLDQALTTWQRAAELYSQLGDAQRQVLSRLHYAQALQAKGLYQQVLRSLKDLAETVQTQPDSPMKATILRQLGDSLRATGNLEDAGQQLKQSLQIAERLHDNALMAASNLSLGNVELGKFNLAQGRPSAPPAQPADTPPVTSPELCQDSDYANNALCYYRRVTELDQGKLGIEASLNWMRLLTHPNLAQWQVARSFYPTVKGLLPALPPGRTTVLAYVGLAENLMTLRKNSSLSEPDWSDIAELLAVAQDQATDLDDPRSQSLVLGTLGALYEQTGRLTEAEALLRQALSLAQQAQADDIRYRWEGQLGRILKAKGDKPGAIAAYTRAYNTLQIIRSDLVTANPDVQFSFRERVEPIYRGLVDLLVKSVPELGDTASLKASTAADQKRLMQARDVMEALQVAELENFFQAACIDKTVSIDTIVNERDTTAAVVYTMLLSDRLEVLLKLPQKTDLVHYAAPASRAVIDTTLQGYRARLTRGANVEAQGRQLYDWLLKPAADEGLLSTDTLKTLIFVLDGDLRLIPMATLHDGTDYLVKKYALSLVLGSDLREPQTLPPREQVQVLAASLENPPASETTYSRLPGVTEELSTIKATNMAVTTLQNDAFKRDTLDRQLQTTDYTIVHLATHGQFGSNRQSTYILAADGRIDVDTLGHMFKSRRQAETGLEMLILSACKTATGDNREVLGIAGAMVQSGARSSIATLWSVDDDASVLFTESLYAELAKPQVSRAEAVRRAQVALLDRYPGLPRLWAPYVLVGSWR